MAGDKLPPPKLPPRSDKLPPPKAGKPASPPELPSKANTLPAPKSDVPPPPRPDNLPPKGDTLPSKGENLPLKGENLPPKAAALPSGETTNASGEKGPPKQAIILIGPPAAPAEMKALYQQAAAKAQSGDNSLVQKLFGMRQDMITYTIAAVPPAKSKLHQILEEKLGKEVAKLDVSVGQAVIRGEMIHGLTISLATTTYPDGTSIGGDLTQDVVKGLEASIAFVFRAEWIKSSVV